MARAKKMKEEVAATPGDTGVVANAPTPAVPATSSVVVEFKGQTREFSKEVHGDNFADLAKQFAEKHGGEVK